MSITAHTLENIGITLAATSGDTTLVSMLRTVKILSLLVAGSAFKVIWHLTHLTSACGATSEDRLCIPTSTHHPGPRPSLWCSEAGSHSVPLPGAEENLALFLQSRAPQLG